MGSCSVPSDDASGSFGASSNMLVTDPSVKTSVIAFARMGAIDRIVSL